MSNSEYSHPFSLVVLNYMVGTNWDSFLLSINNCKGALMGP